jgi:hypothetical protein
MKMRLQTLVNEKLSDMYGFPCVFTRIVWTTMKLLLSWWLWKHCYVGRLRVGTKDKSFAVFTVRVIMRRNGKLIMVVL